MTETEGKYQIPHHIATKPVPDQIEWLLHKINSLKERIESLEAPTPEQTKEEIAEEKEQSALAEKRQRDNKLREDSERTILQARSSAIRALVKLLPKAVSQANAGKPALLRLILRSTK